jgi:adenosylcobinamide kinase/adenosylcobinamide-phosphate guanylyltransferase
LVIGGAGSGKSMLAEQLAKDSGKQVIYIATGEPVDKEMAAKINEHKKNRPKGWQTIELNDGVLSQKFLELDSQQNVILVDCVTFYLSKLINKLSEKEVIEEINEAIQISKRKTKKTIFVTNELGTGIVPLNKASRKFRDIHGKINQMIAREADEVYMAVAGLPFKLK